jgi:DNA-binding Xre family transcriptional regulator
MITVHIKETAQKRGITTAYQLQKATGFQPSMAGRLYRNEVQQIALSTLDTLCGVLKCKVGDLLRHD